MLKFLLLGSNSHDLCCNVKSFTLYMERSSCYRETEIDMIIWCYRPHERWQLPFQTKSVFCPDNRGNYMFLLCPWDWICLFTSNETETDKERDVCKELGPFLPKIRSKTWLDFSWESYWNVQGLVKNRYWLKSQLVTEHFRKQILQLKEHEASLLMSR